MRASGKGKGEKKIRNELTEEQKRVLSYFADIPNHNWFVRKYRILHGGFYKTGFIKNTALLLLA